MQTVTETDRQTPVRGTYDVVVAGGGPTGFVAAIAAARQGARVLLIERYGFLGGVGTAALMVEFGGIYDGREVILGGITHEFLHRMENFGGAYFQHPDQHSMVYDPESMIRVCQDMVLESGAELLLHTLVVDVVKEANCVTGLVLESKSGREAVLANTIIDCTGDGDVAARAGAEFWYGREGDGCVQPVTHVFLLGNVDTTRMCAKGDLVDPIKQAKVNGDWPIPTDQFFSMKRMIKRDAPDEPERGFVFVNATNSLNIDGTDVASLTRAEVEGRRQIDTVAAFLRKYATGFEHCYVDRAAAQVGVRETRRIRGDYVLTREDVLNSRHFEDGVVPSRNSIDVHDVGGKRFAHEFMKQGTHYEIPYRCLLPKGIEGLLVAGRCLSCDHHALGSARVMVVCMPMGEATGLAAAMAAKQHGTPRSIDVQTLRVQIVAGGTVLDTALAPVTT